ncbi:unnamed protein product [Durusdinium trenchii]|uniref:Uncharacterized protein n=2 Tax=Durusdinium trenchii TaxID=1381693 RepID=A0ABP0KEQ7_9DINO
MEPGDQFKDLLKRLAAEHDKLLQRAEEEHEAWLRTLQGLASIFEPSEPRALAAGLDVFPLLAPVPPEQPALPEDLDPWPSFEEEVDFDSNDVEDAVLSVETGSPLVRAISEKMVDMVAVKKVDSLSSAAGRSRQSAKMESLFSAESEKCWRCQLFPWIDYVAGIAVLFNSLLMLLQLELEGRSAAVFLGQSAPSYAHELQLVQAAESSFVFFYLVELLLRISVERQGFFQDVANLFDGVLVVLGVVDVAVSRPFDPSFTDLEDEPSLKLMRSLKSMRALRLVRTFRFVRGLRLLVTACKCFLPSLFWSMVLLAVFMIMGALTLGTTLQTFVADPATELEEKIWVWTRYGTAFRALYTMYEVTFAGNWPTNARPVIEAVSPLFALFYLGYITIIVFALIRVISALFLKDTLDAAQSDADLAVVDKKERRRVYVEKLEALFTAIDVNQTGMITEQQLASVLSLPNIHAYLETLDLDVKESAALFKLLDDGDGEVTLHEFINGIMHCKGEARAIDQVLMHSELRLVAKRLDGLCMHVGFEANERTSKQMQQKAFQSKACHLGTFRMSQSFGRTVS